MLHDSARKAAIHQAIETLQAATAVDARGETIREAVDEYCSTLAGRDKPKTEENRQYYLGRFTKSLGDIPLAELTADDVDLWLRATIPTRSRHNVSTVLAPFLNWATMNGWPAAYEAKPVRKKRDSNERERYLSWSEFGRVTRALESYASQPRSRAVTVDVIWMALLTPFRSGEIATLVADEVSPMGDYIALRDSKTGRRKVWLGPRARLIVKRRRQAASGWRRYLFPGRESRGHIQQSSVSKAWRRLANRAGLEDVVLHDLRRTWASLALDSGERMEPVRVALGHSTKHMTSRYAHLGDERLSEFAARVERRLLDSTRYQLELDMSDPDEVRVEDLSDTQRDLVACPGAEVITKGPGQAQSAKALVRRGVLIETRRCVFRRTDIGERLREQVRR